MLTYADLHHVTGGYATVTDIACPLCGPGCRALSNQNRKVLRVWDDGEGFITFNCARCGERGWARDEDRARVIGTNSRAGTYGQKSKSGFGITAHREPGVPRETPPRPHNRTTPEGEVEKRIALARWLWATAEPVGAFSPVARYLTARHCLLDAPALRYAPARGRHPPAMVALFGLDPFEPLTGVHLTRLSAAGRKAGTDKDKLMIGPSSGQPIVLADNDDRRELIITEGIEDAASFALATGWSTWAAGSAGRIPALLPAAADYDPVFVATDLDWGKPEKQRAGPRALDRALIVRDDLVPLQTERLLGHKVDANAARIKHGDEVLLAVIDYSLARHRLLRGEIGFEQMQRDTARASAMFRKLAPEVM